MPDYNENDQRGHAIPPKPQTIDHAAQASLDADKRAKEANLREAGKLKTEQKEKAEASQAERDANIKATGRREQEMAKPGPGERMAGDALQNSPGRVAKLTPPDPKLTAAQQEMQAKREAARQKDREIMAGRREPEKVPELPTWSPSRNDGDRSR